ncbi:MAG: FAD-binding oxidoreductase [Actinomycetota bacterium]
MTTAKITGWGRNGSVPMRTLSPTSIDDLARDAFPDERLLARGFGRSYGDAAQLDGGTAVLSSECRSIEWLDRDAGVVRVDAGVSIGELIDTVVPLGFFVPVSPGTRHVSIGGAIAADIHGKNHHVDGSFGAHVRSVRLRLADDSLVAIGPDQEAALFWATVGGMGLTGIILDAVIALSPIASSIVAVETSRHASLPELMSVMVESDRSHRFSVAWVDLVGPQRSVLTQGAFARAEALAPHAAGPLRRPRSPNLRLPPIPPLRFVQRPLVRAFNELWFRRAPAEPTISHESITGFFHPLDAIRDWNRLYGPRGFLQWQCVVEDDEALQEICEALSGLPAFFVVLKRLGPANAAPLSFPTTGWTLAVDVPVTASVLHALHGLDQLVVDAGGRIYLAKDARMSRDTFEAGYPRLEEWRRIRRAVDPSRRFRSDLANRLGL